MMIAGHKKSIITVILSDEKQYFAKVVLSQLLAVEVMGALSE